MPMNKQPVTKAEDQIAESVATAQESHEKFMASTTEKIDLSALNDYCNHFTIAVLLAELRNRDPQRADELILWINQALEDGDTAGETVWQWAGQIKRGHQPTGVGPYSAEQPAPPADARRITVPTKEDGDVEVFAVDSHTPGLILTQRLKYDGDRQAVPGAGEWGVRHESSLRIVVLPTAGWPLDVAHTVAEQLGKIGIDWTQSGEAVMATRRNDPSMGAKIATIVTAAEGCRYCTDADHAVPAWRATPSTEAGAA